MRNSRSCGLGVPGAERQRGVRLPVDVRDVVGVPVDDHRHLRRGVLGGDDLAGLSPRTTRRGSSCAAWRRSATGSRTPGSRTARAGPGCVAGAGPSSRTCVELCRVDQAVLSCGQDEHGLSVGEVIGLVHRLQREPARAGGGHGRRSGRCQRDPARDCSNQPRTPQFAHGRQPNLRGGKERGRATAKLPARTCRAGRAPRRSPRPGPGRSGGAGGRPPPRARRGA